jgi:hypothetical protein
MRRVEQPADRQRDADRDAAVAQAGAGRARRIERAQRRHESDRRHRRHRAELPQEEGQHHHAHQIGSHPPGHQQQRDLDHADRREDAHVARNAAAPDRAEAR